MPYQIIWQSKLLLFDILSIEVNVIILLGVCTIFFEVSYFLKKLQEKESDLMEDC